jgi:hypothetical protein
MTRTLLLPILLGTLVACDGGMTLKGRVLQDGALSNEDCTLSLYLPERPAPVTSGKVRGAFDIYFTVSPFDSTYYIQVDCPSGRTWRSEPFDFPEEEGARLHARLRNIEVR